jgi:hypothetical protein
MVDKTRHTCHWPGCTVTVPPKLWGCKAHWFKLPKSLRDEVWRAYRPGQEIDKNPSNEYIAVANNVQRWIKETHDQVTQREKLSRPDKTV